MIAAKGPKPGRNPRKTHICPICNKSRCGTRGVIDHMRHAHKKPKHAGIITEYKRKVADE